MDPRAADVERGVRRDRSTTLLSSDGSSRAQETHRPMIAPENSWRAPERARSGERKMRKRHSFFARASSDASASTRIPTLHSTMSSQSTPQHPPRPETAINSTRRRKTEPLQQIRDSFFGGRKRLTPPGSQDGSSPQDPRASSRSDHARKGDALLPRDHFRSEQDYYRYLRKSSISPPFNFEHVTHTAKQQLPPLETVDEWDLQGHFWSVSAYQRPRRQLNGIKADDLSEKLPTLGVERGAPSSRPTSPVPAELDADRPRYVGSIGPRSSIDEMMFDEARETMFDPATALHRFDVPRRQLRHPQRKSSLVALNEQRLKYLSQLPTAESLAYDPESTGQDNDRLESERLETDWRPPPRGRTPAKRLDAVAEESDRAHSRRTSSAIDRSRQPLPAVPTPIVVGRRSRSSPRPSDPAARSVSSLKATDVTSSARSRRSSSRSSRSTLQSPAVSSAPRSSDPILTSLLSDATWEDDVEFCYQHEAESTCNFDWQETNTTREPSTAESDGGARLSAWMAPSPSQTPEISRSAQQSWTIMSWEPHTQDRRASVVGHRGFLAARTNSLLGNKMSPAPPNLGLAAPKSNHVSILSSVISIAGSDGEASPSSLSPETLQFRGFDGVQRLSSDYLSDPESASTLSSRNRTSSSCSSYDSASRNAALVARETGRWSIASSTSMPELMHSKRRSKASLQKITISRPPESLPQSPGVQTNEKESSIVPRASQIQPMRNTFILPMPQGSEGRAATQAAGKPIQRGRPRTPSRFSRLLAVEEGRQMTAAGGPEWI